MNKFIKSTFIAFLMIVFVPVMVLAEESRIVENENISVTDTDELSMVSNFVNYIGMNDVNYSNWLNASVAYGYNL